MIPGGTAIAEAPVSDDGSGAALAEQGYFTRALADPDLARRYLVDLLGWSDAAQATRFFRLADGAFVSVGTDTPAHTIYAPRLLDDVFSLVIRMSGTAGRVLGGRALPGFGRLRIAAADEIDDTDAADLYAHVYDGRAVTVKLGDPTAPLAEYGTLWEGLAQGASFDRLSVRIALQDALRRLDVALQPNVYAGTGGIEGGDELKGKPKPVLFGPNVGIPPVRVDQANEVWQISDGANWGGIDTVTAVRDNGVAIVADTVVGNSSGQVADVTVVTPGAGKFVWDGNGFLRLGSTPAGIVEIDATGVRSVRTDHSTLAVGKHTGPAIIRRILAARTTWTIPADIDLPAFAEAELRAPFEVGYFAGPDDAARIPEVLDALMGSLLGWWGLTPRGAPTVGVVRPPLAAARDYAEAEILAAEMTRRPLPAKTVRVNFARRWRVLSRDDVKDSGIAEAIKDTLTNPVRVTTVTDATVATAHPEADEVEIGSLLALEADAEAVRDRVALLVGETREVWRVTVRDSAFARQVGETVSLTSARFGLAAGRAFRVIEAAHSARRPDGPGAVDVVLWG